MQRQVKQPGHNASKQGGATDPERIEAIAHRPAATNLTELCAFLGRVG